MTRDTSGLGARSTRTYRTTRQACCGRRILHDRSGSGAPASGVRVTHDCGMGWARGVRGYHDGRGFLVALRHQVKIHLANDVAHRDLDDDILRAGPTDVRDGDLEGSAAAGRFARVGDAHPQVCRAPRPRQPADNKPNHHGQGGGKRDDEKRPLERRSLSPDAAAPRRSLRGQMSIRPSAAPIEAGNANVTTRAVAAPFRASTRPNIASIAAETTNATA